MPNFVSSVLRRLLRPIDAASELVSFQVRLRRSGRGWTLVMERPVPPAVAKAKETASEAFVSDLPAQVMQGELHRLLAQHKDTRHFMRHLAYVERVLRLSGPQALDEAPLDVLQRALDQLERLVMDWSNDGLAELRSRLVMAITDKEAQAQSFHPSADMRSDFLVSQRLQVFEGSPSDFEAIRKRFAPPDEPQD